MKFPFFLFLAFTFSAQASDPLECGYRTRTNAWFKASYESEPTSRLMQVLTAGQITAAGAGAAAGALGVQNVANRIGFMKVMPDLGSYHIATVNLVSAEATGAEVRKKLESSFPKFSQNPEAKALMEKFDAEFSKRNGVSDQPYKSFAEAAKKAGSTMDVTALQEGFRGQDTSRILVRGANSVLSELKPKLDKVKVDSFSFLFANQEELRAAAKLSEFWGKNGSANTEAYDKASARMSKNLDNLFLSKLNTRELGRLAVGRKPGIAGGIVGGAVGGALYYGAATLATAAVVKAQCPGNLDMAQADALAPYVDASIYGGCHLSGGGALALVGLSNEKMQKLCEKIPELGTVVAQLNLDHSQQVAKVKPPKIKDDVECRGRQVAGFAFDSPFTEASHRLRFDNGNKIESDVKSKFGEFQYEVNLDAGVDTVSSPGVVTRAGFETMTASQFQKFFRAFAIPPHDVFENKRYVIGEGIEYGKALMPIAQSICELKAKLANNQFLPEASPKSVDVE